MGGWGGLEERALDLIAGSGFLSGPACDQWPRFAHTQTSTVLEPEKAFQILPLWNLLGLGICYRASSGVALVCHRLTLSIAQGPLYWRVQSWEGLSASESSSWGVGCWLFP